MLESEGARVFAALGYAPRYEHWVMYRLDDRPGTGHAYFVSPDAGEGAAFEEAQALTIKNEFDLYRTSDAFETNGALSRLVWESFSEDELVLRAERREGPEADWALEAEYSLARR